jgi:ABC-2 type transport system ATP-binding protein
MKALEVHNLRKEFTRRDKRGKRRVPALKGVDFEVGRGECVAILGPNGSGKSTLVRLLSTLLLPDGGTATVFGRDAFKNTRDVRRLVNRVSVEASFFKKMSAIENLSYAARFYGLRPHATRERIPEILDRVGFPGDRRDEPMENLSRGMQQKVALARALLTAPILLLLDEPTTGLDPRSKQDVQVFVRQLRQEHDATILITTHDMDEAEALCDRVAIIDQGRIVAMGTVDELKRAVMERVERTEPVTLNEVFMHYTVAHLITEADIERYGSWEKAFEAFEAQKEDEEE